MNLRALLSAAGLLAFLANAGAASTRQRTDSGQFTIYCDDGNLRRQVASFCAQTKDETLALLGESDHWKRPIVVTLALDGTPATEKNPATVRVVDSAVGMKIEILVHVSREPADVNLQKHLIRAVLLEYMYRGGVQTGATYAEPPWWLVEGAVELFRKRDGGPEPHFFRTLIEKNKLPPIAAFLAEKPDELGPTALAVDRALAMSLVQLLTEQPDGRRRLASLVRHWAEADEDPLVALGREFPALAGGAPIVQKWWTLNLARFAAADRLRILPPDETDRQLGALLTFEVPHADGSSQRFAASDFAEYLKRPASRQVLATQHAALTALSARANGLLRPVLSEYTECFALLARGKTRGIRDRLDHAARLREAVTRRAGEIADYLNWFEATQMGSRSHAFDNYLKTANELSDQETKRRDPIARYLDELEREY
ncbi:MAG: hypothetical protein WCF18_17755 [Chthoniobacteraceae bacterium]